jgi:murein DD-endopeptidase / murein LD-carboxypeptidase
MKKVLTIILLIVSINSYSQNKKVLGAVDSIPVLTPDTTLNTFIYHWLGKPYKLGGKTERGIDCSQFNKRLYTDVYKLNLENVCYRQWDQTERIKQDSLQIGDLVFFRSRQSPSGWHCATYIGETLFIHAANRYEGVKISSLLEPRYKAAYKGAGRLKK